MLKTLTLFQWCCHADRTIDFDPLCTVFVGNNGSGKSAALRALRWLALGTWQAKADSFITWGRDHTRITLDTSTHSFARLKGIVDGKPTNAYILDGQTLRFDATLRRGVPGPVADCLRLTEDNFQRQRDRSFWFGLTSGELAKSLNRIINLDAIDQSLASIGKAVRDAKAEEAVAAKRLESLVQTEQSLTWTEQAWRDWCTIEQVEAAMALQSARIASIERSISEAAEVALIRDRALALVACGKSAVQTADELYTRHTKLSQGESLVYQAQKCATERQETRSQLKTAEALYEQYRAQECPLCGK